MARQLMALAPPPPVPAVRRRPRVAGVMTGTIGIAALLGLFLPARRAARPCRRRRHRNPPPTVAAPQRHRHRGARRNRWRHRTTAGNGCSPPAPSLRRRHRSRPPAGSERVAYGRRARRVARANPSPPHREDQKRAEVSPFDELNLKRLRAASLRTIDESDPFK